MNKQNEKPQTKLEIYATRYGWTLIAFLVGMIVPVIPAGLAVRSLAAQVDELAKTTETIKAQAEIVVVLHEPLPANEAAVAAHFVAGQFGVPFDVPPGTPAPRWSVACGAAPMLIGPTRGEVFFLFNSKTRKIEGPFLPAVQK